MIKRNQLIKIRPRNEIIKTLDKDGCLNGLPFMPEMIQYCGQIHKVNKVLEKICHDVLPSDMRQFAHNDVLILEGLYCDGLYHDNCEKACPLLWKTAWLDTNVDEAVTHDSNSQDVLRSKLTTKLSPTVYFCQSSRIEASTCTISKIQRVSKSLRSTLQGNCGLLESFKNLIKPVSLKIWQKIVGDWPIGRNRKTPTLALDLKPGEWVRIKPIGEIINTLDTQGKNRGLHFSRDMASYCGKRYRVRSRLDRMISESDGKMMQLTNTVVLEGIVCDCPFTIGGCPRKVFQYWREIWLERCEAPLTTE